MVLTRRVSAAGAAAVVALSLATARADTELEARAALTAGGTDNVLLDPVNQRASAMTSARAGVWATHVGDGSTQSLSYQLTAQVYTEPLANTTVFHSVAGNSTWEVGRAGSFNLGLSGTAGRMTALDPVLSAQLARTTQGMPVATGGTPMGAPGVGGVPATGQVPPSTQMLLAGRPAGQVLFLSGEVREGYEQGIGQFWHARQLGSASAYVPLEDAPYVRKAYFVQHYLGTERDLERGSVGAQLRLGQTMTPELRSPMVTLPAAQVSFGESWLSWTHDITSTLQSTIAGGAYTIWSFEANRIDAGPEWRGRLLYQPRIDRRVTLDVNRTIVPSLLLGYTLRADTATLEATRALDHAERWSVLAAGNWMRGRQITTTGDLRGLVTVWAARASLRYDPQGPLRYGVDVSRYVQSGDATAELPVPETRQTLIMFIVEAIYPARDRPGQRLTAQR